MLAKGASEAGNPTEAGGKGDGRQEGVGQGGVGPLRHGCDGQAGNVEAGRRTHAGKSELRRILTAPAPRREARHLRTAERPTATPLPLQDGRSFLFSEFPPEWPYPCCQQ